MGKSRQGGCIASAEAGHGTNERSVSQGATVLTEHAKGHTTYFQTYVPKKGKVPLGKCVKWLVVDGKAVQCGKPCKRQRCDDCV